MARLTGIHKFTVLTMLLLMAGTIGPRASGETTILDFGDLPSGEMSSYSSEIPETWWQPFSVEPVTAVSQMQCPPTRDSPLFATCERGEKFLVSISRASEGGSQSRASLALQGNQVMAPEQEVARSASGDDVGRDEPRPDQSPPVLVRNRMEFFWSEGVQSVEFEVLTILYRTSRQMSGDQVDVVLRVFGFPDGVTQGDRADAIRELDVQHRQLHRISGRGRIAMERDGNVIRRAELEFGEPHHVITSAEDALFMGVAEMSYTIAPAPIPTPKLKGLIVEQARKENSKIRILRDLSAQGLSSSMFLSGRIETQHPDVDDPLPDDKKIFVSVQPEIPDVDGMTVKEARQEYGRVIDIQPLNLREFSETDYGPGHIVHQEPAADEGYFPAELEIDVTLRPMMPKITEMTAREVADQFSHLKLLTIDGSVPLSSEEMDFLIDDQTPGTNELFPADGIARVSLVVPPVQIWPVVILIIVAGGVAVVVAPVGPGATFRANRMIRIVMRRPRSSACVTRTHTAKDSSGLEFKARSVRTTAHVIRPRSEGE